MEIAEKKSTEIAKFLNELGIKEENFVVGFLLNSQFDNFHRQ